MSPATREPGASEVFTHGLTSRPFSTAFLATRPAARSTLGFDVLVHDVMAATTTAPCCKSFAEALASFSASVGASNLVCSPAFADEVVPN